MSTDFASAQTELVRARSAGESARLAAQQAAERRRAIALEVDLLARRLDLEDQRAVAEQRRLEELAKRADGEAAAALAAAERADAAAAAALAGFATFSDPRQNVERLSDRSPFALLPVRVETRFVQVDGEGEAAPRNQLWVRVYPDDCWIDTFEDTLSTTELANAQRYWRAIWRAGGVEADERTAWRALVAAHGSGRAGYVVDTYRPTNLAERPTRAAPTDEILVIPTQTPLTAGETAAVSAFWQATWLGGWRRGRGAGSPRRARRGRQRGPRGRARPRLPAVQPLRRRPSEGVTVTTSFVVFPPDPPTKQDPWSQAPKVRNFPERFVVLGFSGGEQVLEAVGGLVTLPLDVGPDPGADASHTIHPEDGDLFVPDELKWMVDFDAAVAAGMGLAIDLTPEQAAGGFDRLLVLGLQLGASDDDGRPRSRSSSGTMPRADRGSRCSRRARRRTTPPACRPGTRAARRRGPELRRPPRRAAVHGNRRSDAEARRAVARGVARRRSRRVRERARERRRRSAAGAGDAAGALAGDTRLLAGQDAGAGFRRRRNRATRAGSSRST